jgi:hypothetical protein
MLIGLNMVGEQTGAQFLKQGWSCEFLVWLQATLQEKQAQLWG